MPTRDRQVDKIALFKGQRSGLPPQSLEASDSALINNMILLQNQPKKVNGVSQYARLESQNTSQPVTWIDYFQDRWLAQKNTGVFRETASGSTIFDKITLSSSNKVFSDKYAGQVFLCNGRELHSINADSVFAFKDVGILPSLGTVNSGNVSVSNGAGLLTTSTTYYWTLTLFDNATGVESPAINSKPAGGGAFILDPFNSSYYAPDSWTKATGAGDDTAAFSFAEISQFLSGIYVSSRATHFRLYRTDVNADAFKLANDLSYNSITVDDGTVPIAAFLAAGQPLVDLTADSNLGVLLDTTKGPPPSYDRMQKTYYDLTGLTLDVFKTYTHLTVFRDSIFGIGHVGLGIGGQGVDSFSAFDSVLNIHEPFLPDYVATSLDINNGDGQQATAVAALGDSTLFIFKSRSAYYLLGTDPSNYTRRVLDTRRGCVHASTVQESPVGVFSLDYSGLVLFDGSGPGKSLSNPEINDIIARIDFSLAAKFYSGYDRINEIYYLGVCVDSSSVPNLQIAYSIRSQGFSILEGLEGSSLKFDISTFGSGNLSVAMIGYKSQGLLLDWSRETTTTFLSNPITSTYLSGPIFAGDPTRKKRARFVYITAETAQDFTIDIDIVIDYGQQQDFSLNDINSGSVYSVYAASLVDSGVNVGVWDSSYWGALKTQKVLKVPVYGVGYVFQVRIKNKQSDNAKYGFKILSVDLETIMMGK